MFLFKSAKYRALIFALSVKILRSNPNLMGVKYGCLQTSLSRRKMTTDSSKYLKIILIFEYPTKCLKHGNLKLDYLKTEICQRGKTKKRDWKVDSDEEASCAPPHAGTMSSLQNILAFKMKNGVCKMMVCFTNCPVKL